MGKRNFFYGTERSKGVGKRKTMEGQVPGAKTSLRAGLQVPVSYSLAPLPAGHYIIGPWSRMSYWGFLDVARLFLLL